MRKIVVAAVFLLLVSSLPVAAQRGSARTGPVTFTIFVKDSSGAPVTDVRVALTGPAQRSSRTEGGRTVFEDLPSGDYTLRFEKPGFVALEKQVTGRGSRPIPVDVTIEAVPPPPVPIAAVTPLKQNTDAKLVVLDMPAFIEKNYVGKAADRTTPMACAAGGSSTLIQINVAIVEHTHPDADEFIYVIAGQGSARMGERVESLGPGVFMMIPRGVAHAFAVGSKKPLVFVSTRAGEKCS
jgi:mannose-6-phosphate isomerase-like protein (cupin superfamily)